MSGLSIELESPASSETVARLDKGLDAYNLAHGMPPFADFTLPLKTAAGEIKGGVSARCGKSVTPRASGRA